MAYIHNVYVHVTEESVSNNVETSSHPTESGMPISDTVRRQPIEVRLTGKIVFANHMETEHAISQLTGMQKNGDLVTYTGQCGAIRNLQIQDFNCNYNNKNFGGADFDMSLKEVKIAKVAYKKEDAIKITNQKKKKSLKVNDMVVFAGGSVYEASDSKKAASTRGSSTCTLTKISGLANATHIYHLISNDGRGVYGWVNADRVAAPGETVNSSTNGGTQQVNEATKDSIYHVVKKGDTLWKIRDKYFKHLNLSIDDLIKNNPDAFSTPGKATTLKVGARLRLT